MEDDLSVKTLRNKIIQTALLPFFSSSQGYWDARYRLGGTSGSGSYGHLAEFKADFLNRFVEKHGIRSVIEFGCGDGNQLSLALYPKYLGFDVAKEAIKACQEKFENDPKKSFMLYDPSFWRRPDLFLGSDLTLSLDVIFHLVEDRVYERYLRDLFSMSQRYVIVYSSDDENSKIGVPHVRHRKFTLDVARLFGEYRLESIVENDHPGESFCNFFIFKKILG